MYIERNENVERQRFETHCLNCPNHPKPPFPRALCFRQFGRLFFNHPNCPNKANARAGFGPLT